VKTHHAQRIYFEQLKRVVPIAAILSRYGIVLDRAGKAACPIHQGTGRSFVVDENKNLWKCFSPKCNRGGSILELVSELEGIEIREAALRIADWFAIKPGSNVQQPSQRRSSSMSDTEKRPPDMRLYSSRKRGEGQKDHLTLIGGIWINEYEKDGKKKNALKIRLDAMPIGPDMVAFDRDPEWEEKHKREPHEEPKENGTVKSFAKKK
jgi:hypothetical protein